MKKSQIPEYINEELGKEKDSWVYKELGVMKMDST